MQKFFLLFFYSAFFLQAHAVLSTHLLPFHSPEANLNQTENNDTCKGSIDLVLNQGIALSYILSYLSFSTIVQLKNVQKIQLSQLSSAQLCFSRHSMKWIMEKKIIIESMLSNILQNACFYSLKQFDFLESILTLSTLEELPEKTEELYLSWTRIQSQRRTIPLEEWFSIVLRKFSNLKALDLSHQTLFKIIHEFSESSHFSKLETLTLRNILEIKEDCTSILTYFMHLPSLKK